MSADAPLYLWRDIWFPVPPDDYTGGLATFAVGVWKELMGERPFPGRPNQYRSPSAFLFEFSREDFYDLAVEAERRGHAWGAAAIAALKESGPID